MGAWLMGTLFLWVIASQNFREVDKVLDLNHPEISKIVQSITYSETRSLLRLLASELNRFYFKLWGGIQVFIGGVIALLLCIYRYGYTDRLGFILVIGMWSLSIILLFWITPELTILGRQLDFSPKNPSSEKFALFWNYHFIYVLTDFLKFAIGLWSITRLSRRLF